MLLFSRFMPKPNTKNCIFISTITITHTTDKLEYNNDKIDFTECCNQTQWQSTELLSWNVNALLRENVMKGQWEEALRLYYRMPNNCSCSLPNNLTFRFVIKACAALSALQQGEDVHRAIIIRGFDTDIFISNGLIDMYAKCGDFKNARQVFDKISQRDLVSWNSMIAGYAQNGYFEAASELFHQMQMMGVNPDAITWNAMIAGYAYNGYGHEALKVFNQMQLVGTKANSITVASLISSCTDLESLQLGEVIHGYVIRSGFESHLLVGNALIDMYSKCRNVADAHNVFVGSSRKDVISWNAMIAGYIHNGHCDEALEIFHQMHLASTEPNLVTWNAMISGFTQNGRFHQALELFSEMQVAGMKPNSVTIASILPACVHMADSPHSKQVYSYIVNNRFKSNALVGSALVDMYAKLGNIEAAQRVFDDISEGERDVVSWTAMIAGYTQNGHCEEALELFRKMQVNRVMANSVTIASVLPACARLGALQLGKEIHGYNFKRQFRPSVFVGNALIDMYAKCGNVDYAYRVFCKMPQRNTVSWNSMIAGYGVHGYGNDALTLFYQMQQIGVKPNDVTFLAVLSACSHAGLVDEGWQYFYSMHQDYCITPKVEHYACMVDLLGRTGLLYEAWEFIKNMPFEPHAHVWAALLAACRIHCNIDLGERVAKCLFELEPKNAGYYVLLSNMYAMVGRWDGVAKMRIILKDLELKKLPGCSWIEVKNKVHSFLSGENYHLQLD